MMRATKRMMNNGLVAGAMALATGLMSPAVEADTFTYTGGGEAGVWGDPDNWDLGDVPGAGDHVFIDMNVTFHSFDGHAAGSIQTDNTELRFSANQTFTMDNNGDTAVISTGDNSSDRLYMDNMTLTFTGDLDVISGEMEVSASFVGPGTLRVIAPHFNGWKSEGGTIDVGRVDVSGSSQLAIHGDNAAPDFTGQTIYLGTKQIRAHFQPELAPLFELAHIEMDESYLFMQPASSYENEHVTLASWLVGDTLVPAGTYDVNSTSIGDADFGTLFGNTGVSVTVIPEPSSLALLAAGGMLMLRRRAKAC